MQIEHLSRDIRVSKYILGGVLVVSVLAYISRFYNYDAGDPDAWGQFGDFIGGVMNPLIAFGAFYWLATSVALQKSELSETRKALVDSHKAQQQQADTSLLTAKIGTINIRLSLVTTRLTHLRNRQAALVDLQRGKGPAALTWDESKREFRPTFQS